MKTKLFMAAAQMLMALAAPGAMAASLACGSDLNCRTLTPEEAAQFMALKEKLGSLMPQPDAKAFSLSQAEPNFYSVTTSDRGRAAEFGTARVRCRSYAGGCFPDGFGDTDSQISYQDAGATSASKPASKPLTVSLRAWPLPLPSSLGPASNAKRGPGFFSYLDVQDPQSAFYSAYVGQRQNDAQPGPIRLKTPPAKNMSAPVAISIEVRGPKAGVQAFADKINLAALRDVLATPLAPAAAPPSSRDSKQCGEERQKVAQLDAQINKTWDALDARKATYKHLLEFERMVREQWERDQNYDGPPTTPRPQYQMDWQKAADEAAAFRKELVPQRPVQHKLLKERYAQSAAITKACGGGT